MRSRGRSYLNEGTKLVAELEDRPSQSRILGGDGNDRTPIAASLLQRTSPATEPILFIADAGEHSARTHHQQTAQIMIAGFRDSTQARLTTAAVLTRCEADPRGDLAASSEIVSAADARHQCARGGGSDPGALHQTFAALVSARRLRDR